MFDTTVGRWTTEDPLSFDAGQSNLAEYVGNGPTNGTDPTGLEPLPTPQGAAKDPPGTPEWIKRIPRDTNGQIPLPNWKQAGYSTDLFNEISGRRDGFITTRDLTAYFDLKAVQKRATQGKADSPQSASMPAVPLAAMRDTGGGVQPQQADATGTDFAKLSVGSQIAVVRMQAEGLRFSLGKSSGFPSNGGFIPVKYESKQKDLETVSDILQVIEHGPISGSLGWQHEAEYADTVPKWKQQLDGISARYNSASNEILRAILAAESDAKYDALQTNFALVGLIPVVGVPFDALNAVIYEARGKHGDAGLSALAVIPFAGLLQVSKVGKLTRGAKLLEVAVATDKELGAAAQAMSKAEVAASDLDKAMKAAQAAKGADKAAALAKVEEAALKAGQTAAEAEQAIVQGEKALDATEAGASAQAQKAITESRTGKATICSCTRV